MAETEPITEPQDQPLQGKRIAFVGKLGGVTKKEVQRLVRNGGGVPVDQPSCDADYIVVGADQLPLGEHEELLDAEIRDAAARGMLEIITETQFWELQGIVDAEQHIRRLYTPAMLADLLGVSVTMIRRWHRKKLINPARMVHRLPYFDFQEVATARRLADLLAAGVSPTSIEKKLDELAAFIPHVDRPLAQLSVIVQGRELLLRRGDGLVEPSGQMRMDFDALEEDAKEDCDADTDGNAFDDSADQDSEIAFDTYRLSSDPSLMLEEAERLEDENELEAAMDLYRAAMAAIGPHAEICFHLAELLYRTGDLSGARERYYMAIELDEDYVEARSNLGCVLAELDEPQLALAAFQGALEYHDDYPDVHYHVAAILDRQERTDEAVKHWRRFLELAPESAWAEEARLRLGEPLPAD
jgi:tetratricopeptide (TPR) repeat protein